MATSGTAAVLERCWNSELKSSENWFRRKNIYWMSFSNGEAQLIINTLTKGKQPERDGFRIRREAVENGVPCLTSLDTADAILRVIESMNFSAEAMESDETRRLFLYD